MPFQDIENMSDKKVFKRIKFSWVSILTPTSICCVDVLNSARGRDSGTSYTILMNHQ